ncbi:hypothetical protein GQ53DRAFT_289997 [Thozetella sp. PMI_491]|nr:hypothetical protein GQ53DRAFT_289997 [Thozetella sp. PMI_491]
MRACSTNADADLLCGLPCCCVMGLPHVCSFFLFSSQVISGRNSKFLIFCLISFFFFFFSLLVFPTVCSIFFQTSLVCLAFLRVTRSGFLKTCRASSSNRLHSLCLVGSQSSRRVDSAPQELPPKGGAPTEEGGACSDKAFIVAPSGRACRSPTFAPAAGFDGLGGPAGEGSGSTGSLMWQAARRRAGYMRSRFSGLTGRDAGGSSAVVTSGNDLNIFFG